MVIIYFTMFIEFSVLFLTERKIKIKKLVFLFSFIIFFEVFLLFLLKYTYINGISSVLLLINIMPNLYWSLSLDFLNYIFLLLTSFLLPLCFLYMNNLSLFNYKTLAFLLVILEFLLFCAFITSNLLFFYVFFEGVLIPMSLIIGIWGSRQRKIHAFFLFFIYTLIGSFFLLVSLIMIFSHCQSLEFFYVKSLDFSFIRQQVIWWCLFLGFAIKIPMVPFHVWLPEAHTEAPTIGSVLLAAVLLKLGSYGMLKYLYGFFPLITLFNMPFVLIFCFIGMFYISLTAIRQIDIKKIIAYSSIAHMSYVVAGVCVVSLTAALGSVYLMLGHGLVSAGLFFSIGCLYERYKTRNIKYYGGLVFLLPKLAFCFLVLTLANIAFPGTSNFVGEFLILLSLVNDVSLFNYAFFALIMIVFGSVYSFWLFNRIFYGKLESEVFTSDINKTETFIILNILFLIIFLGFYPSIIFSNLAPIILCSF